MPYVARSPKDIKDSALTTLRNALSRRGKSIDATAPGGDFDVEFSAVANEVAVAESNSVIASTTLVDETDSIDDIIRESEIIGFRLPREATSAAGDFEFAATALTDIPPGAQLTSESGLTYLVVGGGITAPGARVAIVARDSGSRTNLAEGDALKFVQTPAFAVPVQAVASGGVVGGNEAETIEEYRQAHLSFRRSRPRGENPAATAVFAEVADIVQKAFVYPAARGPATVHVAVCTKANAVGNRAISSLVVAAEVAPIVEESMSRSANVIVTSVVNVPSRVCLGIVTDKYWVDKQPWPPFIGSGPRISGFGAAPNEFVLDADTNGLSTVELVGKHVSIFTKALTVSRATIVAVYFGGPGVVNVTLSFAVPGVSIGDCVFPSHTYESEMATAVVDYFKTMGPGEKSPVIPALAQNIKRRPFQEDEWPSAIDGRVFSAIGDAMRKALLPSPGSFLFTYRETGAVVSFDPYSAFPAPVPPGSVDAPHIFTPRHLGFYKV